MVLRCELEELQTVTDKCINCAKHYCTQLNRHMSSGVQCPVRPRKSKNVHWTMSSFGKWDHRSTLGVKRLNLSMTEYVLPVRKQSWCCVDVSLDARWISR
jgi:hypothetical protein